MTNRIHWVFVSLSQSFVKICKGSLANAQTIGNRLDLNSIHDMIDLI